MRNLLSRQNTNIAQSNQRSTHWNKRGLDLCPDKGLDGFKRTPSPEAAPDGDIDFLATIVGLKIYDGVGTRLVINYSSSSQ